MIMIYGNNVITVAALFTRNMKQRWSLKNVVEPSNNPFDEGRIITGLGNKRKKSHYQTQREKILERIEKEKDSDIRAELKKGKYRYRNGKCYRLLISILQAWLLQFLLFH
jgi:hypothetical protein